MYRQTSLIMIYTMETDLGVSTSDIYGRGVKRHICLVQTKVMTNMELELMIRMYQLKSSSMWLVVGMPKGQS